jgi:hypothetical protein
MHQEYVSDTCEIVCGTNGQKKVAEVLSFQQKKFLTVSVDRKIKVEMRWNGHTYTASMGGLDFESDGPVITITNTKRRR